MLEIVHDLAPNAALGFATAFTSDASFADNIRGAALPRGCDIIVDDVLYFDESPFQDGPIAQAVNDVTADGALYFSSAGNEGNVADGTAGNWEGDFVDSGVGRSASSPATAHDFDPGPARRRSSTRCRPTPPACRSRCSGPTRWASPPTTTTCTLVNAQGSVVGVLPGRPGRHARPVRAVQHRPPRHRVCAWPS